MFHSDKSLSIQKKHYQCGANRNGFDYDRVTATNKQGVTKNKAAINKLKVHITSQNKIVRS